MVPSGISWLRVRPKVCRLVMASVALVTSSRMNMSCSE